MVLPRYSSERISTSLPTRYVVPVCVPCTSTSDTRGAKISHTPCDGVIDHCFGAYVSCQYDAAPWGRFSIRERNSVTLHMSCSLNAPSHAGMPVYRTPVRTT